MLKLFGRVVLPMTIAYMMQYICVILQKLHSVTCKQIVHYIAHALSTMARHEEADNTCCKTRRHCTLAMLQYATADNSIK